MHLNKPASAFSACMAVFIRSELSRRRELRCDVPSDKTGSKMKRYYNNIRDYFPNDIASSDSFYGSNHKPSWLFFVSHSSSYEMNLLCWIAENSPATVKLSSCSNLQLELLQSFFVNEHILADSLKEQVISNSPDAKEETRICGATNVSLSNSGLERLHLLKANHQRAFLKPFGFIATNLATYLISQGYASRTLQIAKIYLKTLIAGVAQP